MIYFVGILIPFLGTTLGALFVLFMRQKLNSRIEKMLLGFSAGVMLASSIWSLIIPAVEMLDYLNYFIAIPISLSFLFGIALFVFLENMLEKYKKNKKTNNKSMMMLAVIIHNIPEGMIIGIALASAFYGNAYITLASAITLSLGIGIQNIPEGAIISMPLRAEGMEKKKALGYGVLSGVVEPVAAIASFLITRYIEITLPYLLMFASGAMIYVVVNELIPESKEEKSHISILSFSFGFLIMMILDTLL